MRIKTIRPFVLRWPEPNDFDAMRMTVLVAVDSTTGVTGWGEAIAMWPEACTATVDVIEQGFAPLLIGKDWTTAEAWRAMKTHSWWYGEGGIAALAISAIDMALWDLAAKEAGKPLATLLGGALHDRLPACASLHVNQPSIDESVRDIAGFIDGGFRSTKLGLGKRGRSKAGRDPDYDVALVAALREEIGSGTEIMVDAGNGTQWSLDTAIRTVSRMEEHGISWIEEPFHPSRVADHVALAKAVETPVAAGEREWNSAGYARWIETGAISVFGIDPARVEGITGFRQAAAAIEAAGATVNAHAWSTAVLTAASLHLSFASSSARLFELKPLPGPMQFDLVSEPFWHSHGWIALPESAGHGADPDLDVLRKFLVR